MNVGTLGLEGLIVNAVRRAGTTVAVNTAEAAANGGKGFVDGFRAVSTKEADDIARNGFRPEPSGRSMGDKWFSETRKGAEEFTKTFPELESVVHVRVPQDVYGRTLRMAPLRSCMAR